MTFEDDLRRRIHNTRAQIIALKKRGEREGWGKRPWHWPIDRALQLEDLKERARRLQAQLAEAMNGEKAA